MTYSIKINNIDSVNEVMTYWSDDDLMELLTRFNYADADQIKQEDLSSYLLLAITDFEPPEAAAVLLTYKLSEHLTEGQINQISHEMLEDKVCEEYPDISLHAALFHINQLLFKAYNGKFPNAKASIIEFSCTPQEADAPPVTKTLVLKAFAHGLSDSTLLKRLFAEQLSGSQEFAEAENIIWDLDTLDNVEFRLLISEYWIKQDDFSKLEFEAEVTDTVAA